MCIFIDPVDYLERTSNDSNISIHVDLAFTYIGQPHTTNILSPYINLFSYIICFPSR